MNQINGIAWDANSAHVFVGYGTNVLVIDPDVGQVTDIIFVGAQVNRAAVPDDGKYV